MKKVLIILMAVAVLAAAVLGLWQFVPLFGISWQDLMLRMEYYQYTAEPLMEGIGFPYSNIGIFGYSSVPGFPVVMEIPDGVGGYDAGITISIRAEDGSWVQEMSPVRHIERLGSTVTVTNGLTLYWEDAVHDVEKQELVSSGEFWASDKDTTFIDAVIRKDGHIIGYFVGRFQVAYHKEYGRLATIIFEIVGSASFPKIDGEYQKISEECIEARIEMIKDSTRNPPKYYMVLGDE